MNRNTLIPAGILISIILGYAAYFHLSDSETSENQRSSSDIELAEQLDSLGTTTISDNTVVDATGGELIRETSVFSENTIGFEPSYDISEPTGITQAQRAFSGEISIVEAVRNASREEEWGYDGLIKNLIFWEGLCNVPESEFNQEGGPVLDDTRTTGGIIKTFCANFPSDFSSELSDFASVSLQETAAGTNDWSRRLNSLSDLGPEAALQSAIIDLSDALYSGNYAQIADIIWFLGTSGLLGKELKGDNSVSKMFSDIEVMIAVNASIYCARLGGCGGTHPVTLGLCFQFGERPCANPDNLYHAVEQILTGRELIAFYQMNQGIISLVGQHRRGDF